jgi:hypothetical protein
MGPREASFKPARTNFTFCYGHFAPIVEPAQHPRRALSRACDAVDGRAPPPFPLPPPDRAATNCPNNSAFAAALANVRLDAHEEVRMKLSEEDKRAFYNGGFFVMRALFTPDEVRAAREALERLYATAQTLTQTGDHDGAFFALSFPLGAPVIVQRVVWAGGSEPGLLRLSEDPRLVEPALELLGASHCQQLLCQAHFKMPNDGVAFDWHQDIQHRDKGNDTWRDVNGRGSYVQTILLVDDMNEENGPLEFLPSDAVELDARGRMQRSGGYGVAAAPGEGPRIDASKAVSVTGRAGDVLFFGPYAVHGSTPNSSAWPRRVLINGYAAPGANGRVYPGKGACRTLPAPHVAPRNHETFAAKQD